MILSNIEILKCIQKGLFEITPFDASDPAEKPFNTSAVDLRLGNEIFIPKSAPSSLLDITKSGIALFLTQNSDKIKITEDQPYILKKGKFVLMSTYEKIRFPLNQDCVSYCARVEGRSSIARCGVLVHFTAPTIHAGFEGPITLEILNLGPNDFLLKPLMYICQLIIEEVNGCPIKADSQFQGQNTPAGYHKN